MQIKAACHALLVPSEQRVIDWVLSTSGSSNASDCDTSSSDNASDLINANGSIDHSGPDMARAIDLANADDLRNNIGPINAGYVIKAINSINAKASISTGGSTNARSSNNVSSSTKARRSTNANKLNKRPTTSKRCYTYCQPPNRKHAQSYAYEARQRAQQTLRMSMPQLRMALKEPGTVDVAQLEAMMRMSRVHVEDFFKWTCHGWKNGEEEGARLQQQARNVIKFIETRLGEVGRAKEIAKEMGRNARKLEGKQVGNGKGNGIEKVKGRMGAKKD